jgi:hypothetical protein
MDLSESFYPGIVRMTKIPQPYRSRAVKIPIP